MAPLLLADTSFIDVYIALALMAWCDNSDAVQMSIFAMEYDCTFYFYFIFYPLLGWIQVHYKSPAATRRRGPTDKF